MPQFIVLSIIVATMLIEYLADTRLLPRPAAFIPELLGGLAIVYVIAEGSKSRFRLVHVSYWLIFGAILVHLLCGIAINQVEPGALITGLRYYVRSIPLFLLAAVYRFSDAQVSTQLRLIVALSLLQLPVTLYQLSVPGMNHHGDYISGTLLSTAFLSPFLICVACVLTGLLVRRQISLLAYSLLLVGVLVPTTINETKITMFLLPLGLTTVFVLAAPRRQRLMYLVRALGVSVLGVVAFLSLYAYTQREVFTSEGMDDLLEFYSGGDVDEYLETGAGIGAGEGTFIGRVDSLMVPLEYVARDPVHLWFGLGMGNASPSPLGSQFEGYYATLFEHFMSFSAVRLVLETGVGGLLLVLLLVLRIFVDAWRVSNADQGGRGAIAAGWLGVSVVMFTIVFYADTIVSSPIAFLYWYFSGLVASDRMRGLEAVAVGRVSADPVPDRV